MSISGYIEQGFVGDEDVYLRIRRLEKRLEREKKARLAAEDILEHKSREIYAVNKQLHENARLLEETVINAKDGVMITDADLENGGPHIIYVNDAFTKITGYRSEEVIGKTPRILQGAETDSKTLEMMKERLKEGRSFQGELKNYSKNGRPYWLDISITPVRNEEGEITHFTAIERDITVRKMYESELQQSKKRADTASLAKSDFLATMSHELRTPMNGIIGLSELLLEAELGGEGHELAQTINGSAQNLLELINDILDFSKIEANEFSLEMHAFDVKELVKNSIGFLRHLAREKGLDFRVELDLDLPEQVFNDCLRIRQVLNNLVGNAIKFTDKGGISISIAPMPSKNPTHIQFTVSDTGIGIPDDKIGLIFNKFQTLEGRNFGGTGLGLAISKQLVDMMDGEIGVQSRLGEGTTFCFSVGAHLDELKNQERACLSSKGSLQDRRVENNEQIFKGLRILSADDHPTNLMMMSKILKKLGAAEVVEASQGLEAVEQYKTNGPFDCVVMDYHMPKMDGLEAARLIRIFEAAQGMEAVPIVAVTADAMRETQEKCLDAGMNDYLSKPIVRRRLVDVLLRHLPADVAEDAVLTRALEPAEAHDGQSLEAVIDLSHLRQFTDGDIEEEQAFFDIFLEQAVLGLEALEDHMSEEGAELWKKTAHKLKGAAANLGANTLSGLCFEAERRYDEPESDKKQLLAAIQAELVQVDQFMKALHA
ncbi:MAG: response regulator [Alphaproteobacteria bacterium]|nr:response regulator [Alphaproteobacteria bacterium]